MLFVNVIGKYKAELGVQAAKSLLNNAIAEVQAENPTVKFTVSEIGVSITNYKSALRASEDGSILCEGQETAESYLEDEIARSMYFATTH